jgi:acyl-CoA thioester hydrolase
MAEPFVHRMRVRYAECDAQGVLFNAHYLAYIDHSITELWRAAYGGYGHMLELGVDVVVAEAQLRFLEGARFDQEVDAEMLVTHLGTTSLRSHHRLVRVGDRASLMEADMRHVWIDRETKRKTPIPEWARAGVKRWYAPES